MNNTIQNPQMEVSKGMKLNQKDYLTCLLTTLKELQKGYSLILTEISNENLYNQLKTTFDSISTIQRKVYEQSFRYGWYIVERASQEQIDAKLNMLSKEFQELKEGN